MQKETTQQFVHDACPNLLSKALKCATTCTTLNTSFSHILEASRNKSGLVSPSKRGLDFIWLWGERSLNKVEKKKCQEEALVQSWHCWVPCPAPCFSVNHRWWLFSTFRSVLPYVVHDGHGLIRKQNIKVHLLPPWTSPSLETKRTWKLRIQTISQGSVFEIGLYFHCSWGHSLLLRHFSSSSFMLN